MCGYKTTKVHILSEKLYSSALFQSHHCYWSTTVHCSAGSGKVYLNLHATEIKMTGQDVEELKHLKSMSFSHWTGAACVLFLLCDHISSHLIAGMSLWERKWNIWVAVWHKTCALLFFTQGHLWDQWLCLVAKRSFISVVPASTFLPIVDLLQASTNQ